MMDSFFKSRFFDGLIQRFKETKLLLGSWSRILSLQRRDRGYIYAIHLSGKFDLLCGTVNVFETVR